VNAAAILVVFSLAHSLEDFVYGTPERFGFEVAPAAALIGIVYGVHILLIVAASRGQTLGYIGNLLIGAAWLVGSVLDHLGEVLYVWPYRGGVLSKAFEIGLMVSAVVLVAVSFKAWQARSQPE
jgi:hypothetical protein